MGQGAGSKELSFPAPCPLSPAPSRRGLTLVEVLLVLTLLVIVGAVTAPILSGSISQARLRHSGDLLRAAWGRARLAAMEAGDPYVFRFEPNGPRYQIVQLSSLTAEDGAEQHMLPPEDADDLEYSDADVLRLSQARLPAGVVFAEAQVSAVPPMAAAAAAADSGWASPIVFYADGTSSDAAVHLQNEEGAALRVTLRGLTGSSRAGEVGGKVTP